MDSYTVRQELVETLRLDLIGPRPQDLALERERLPQTPARWYLTGFLAPADAPEEQRAQDSEEELDEGSEPFHGSDDSSTPERGSTKRLLFPSSIGLSILVDEETTELRVDVSWGDYTPEATEDEEGDDGNGEEGREAKNGGSKRRFAPWVREPRAESVRVDLQKVAGDGTLATVDIPGSGGLEVACLARPTTVRTIAGSLPVHAVSVFVVNRRPPVADNDLQDTAFAFQVEVAVEADTPIIPRADLHGLETDDWDERLADLHYGDVLEYSVGHNVSTRTELVEDTCRRVHTEWMPSSRVDRVEPTPIPDVEFGMEALGSLSGPVDAKKLLAPLVDRYRQWIGTQRTQTATLSGRRHEVAEELVRRAERTASRIEAGISLLADPQVLAAFQVANRTMAAAARRRQGLVEKKPPGKVSPPQWRPFQLAYILMNLRGIADPTHREREVVDLLFFPTGGGKTEAYLGLAAFTLVLRRLRDPDPTYRGLSVLMRYTLRLLTLDQLDRAAALMCALELEREKAPNVLGTWPFEIGLWVGRAATPNYMGEEGKGGDKTARIRTLRFARDSSREPPLPIRQCPWCGTPFTKYAFRLYPNRKKPTDLHVTCVARTCDFNARKNRRLPIVAVDEPIYERVPAFMIATADKFAGLPWTGETAKFFQGGDPDNPRPPDLIIQDELHLISGPLGTMAGLYETAIDHLCTRQVDEQPIRPKVIASTATVRLAGKQIQALFNRKEVQVFPASGIDRRDSFFAIHAPQEDPGARMYLGIAAQGRGPKVIFLRAMTTLMAAAQAAWNAAQASGASPNPADPYMSAVAYFNALRELGSARRIVEDEIRTRLQTYSDHKRLNEAQSRFANRTIAYDPVELTSRVGTSDVAEAKRRLDLGFIEKGRIDVALATNMISVGLDITRLGLMVVSGQPKTTAEYIQATSRVGRDPDRPGLVVALLNIHKPRDRSHYERFPTYHESFYRSVEATGVTPFSPRALDRGLPAVTVAMARLGIENLTPMLAAGEVEDHPGETKSIAQAIGSRAASHSDDAPPALAGYVQQRVQSLIDDWAGLAKEAQAGGMDFGYALGRERGVSVPLLREMIDPDRQTLSDRQLRFRAPRSLRDVEPSVLLGIKTPEGRDIA